MNKKWSNAVTALLLTVLVPWLLCNTLLLLRGPKHEPQPGPTFIEATNGVAASTVRVLTGDGTVVKMDLEEYVAGVIMGEMPENFHPEALKAQAVVARTYTMRMRENTSKHPDADVCLRSECCQSYRSGVTETVQAAVDATAGQVLMYDGKLIEATYFSSSGGKTEAALAVWGSDVPYLQSVDSPESAEGEEFLETVTFTAEEFRQAIGIDLEGPCGNWFGAVTYTDGGGVDHMVIGDHKFMGTELRKLLGLRSTAMVISAVGDHIIITTKGHGHRVGMSQYGAEAMAVSGAAYDEILAYYYQGTTLELFVDKGSPLG